MTDNFISAKHQHKSFVGNTEQIDIDLIEWNDYNDNICPQCGHNHSHKPIGGSSIPNMISFLDRNATSKR